MSTPCEVVDGSKVLIHDFTRIDGKMAILEAMSSECAALLTKVSINCSGHNLINQQAVSELMPRRKLKSTLLPI